MVAAVSRFRLEFVDDGSTIDVDADDFDDDGTEVSLYRYVPPGADPLAATTQKEVIASFERTSLVGPPQQVQ
jgi:hypothetical protein